jgi:predicted nucleotidyltransferase
LPNLIASRARAASDRLEHVPAIAEQLLGFFASHGDGVVAAYLFGSVARGSAHDASDVDVAVLLDKDPSRTYEGLPLPLEGALERVIRRPVQVVVLNQAPVDLVHRVLRDGLLVCDRDKGARIRFEVRARAAYLDLLPVLRRYRRQGHAA